MNQPEKPTMHIARILGATAIALTLGLGLTACEKEKGPAEKLGAQLDKTAGDMKAAAEDAKEDVKKAVDDAHE